MRIAMIGAKGIPATVGGIERHVEELSARLAASGFDVTVYARPWYTGRAPWSEHTVRGVRVVVLPSVLTKHLDAISATFLATLRAIRERHDVYHFHGVGPALLSFLPRMFDPSARVVATFHCVDRRHAKWGWVARLILAAGERAACVFPHETIAVGESLAAYCRARHRAEVTWIPNGVATPSVVPASVARHVLQTHGLAPRRYLLVVARFVPHKGIHTAIAAFRELLRERPGLGDLQLAVVGDSAFTDAYRDELILAAGGDARVRFLGPVHGSALQILFAHGLAFIHASTSEGLPIVVLEAAVSGCLPVVSDIPEHREIIDRIGGCMFRVGDVRHLRTVLEVVVGCAASLPGAGDAVRTATQRTYDWDTIAARTAERYRVVVAARHRPRSTVALAAA